MSVKFTERKSGTRRVNKRITVAFSEEEVRWVAERRGISLDKAVDEMLEIIIDRASASFQTWTISREDPDSLNMEETGQTPFYEELNDAYDGDSYVVWKG
jgi:KaiC/GvpD/RAD55 family RecA-like ATPase